MKLNGNVGFLPVNPPVVGWSMGKRKKLVMRTFLGATGSFEGCKGGGGRKVAFYLIV